MSVTIFILYIPLEIEKLRLQLQVTPGFSKTSMLFFHNAHIFQDHKIYYILNTVINPDPTGSTV